MPSACTSCGLRGVCVPSLLGAEHDAQLARLVHARRKLRLGEALFRAGDAFDTVYAVFGGSFKVRVAGPGAQGQLTGFYMAGELLGLDGFASGRHQATALALEESHVCVLPLALIEEIGRELPALHRGLRAALAREIVRKQRMMLALGTMRAEQRLAVFLLDLSRRFERRGYSAREYLLCMTREDIGSYLGFTTETASRLLTGLREAGIVEARQRRLRILDVDGLEARAGGRLPAGGDVRPCVARPIV